MPTLGVEAKITYAENNTRSTIDNFYRGIKTKGIVLRPYVTLSDESESYDVSNTNIIVFISDEYEGTNPFDITLTSTDIGYDGENISFTLKGTGFLIVDTRNIIRVTVTNTTEEEVSYRLLS